MLELILMTAGVLIFWAIVYKAVGVLFDMIEYLNDN